MSEPSPPSSAEPGSASPGLRFPRFVRDVFNYGLGSVLPKVIGFLLIPVYTAFLSPADYGILDLAASLGTLLAVLMKFGVPGAVTRFYYDFGEGRALSDYLSTTLWFLLLNGLLIAALVLGAGPWVIELVLPGLSYFPYVVLVVIAALMAGPANVQLRLLRAREQSAYSAALNTIQALATLGLTVFFVAGLRWGAMGHLLGTALAACVFMLQAVWYLRRNLAGKANLKLLTPSLVYAVGLLPSHLLASVEPIITRSVLSHSHGLVAVGLLAIAVRFTQPLSLLLTAFTSAYEPVYFATRLDAGADGMQRLAALARSVWVVALGAALAVTFLGPIGLELMTPPEYHGAAPLVPVLTLAFLARVVYNLLGMEIFFAKKTHMMPLVSLLAVSAIVGVTFLTVPAYGAIAAAWALVTGAITAMAVATFVSVRMVRLPHDWTSLARSTTLAVAVYALFLLLPAGGLPLRVVLALGALTLFPLLLWLSGDPTMRGSVHWLRSRSTRHTSGDPDDDLR